MSKWSHNIDHDPIHPDWEHTMEGEYRPKNVTYTADLDLVYNGRIVTQDTFDQIRKRAIEPSIW